jgi:hypothetical protein
VWPDPEQLGHPLEGACRLEEDLGVTRIVKSLREVGQERGRAFDADEIDNLEPGRPDLARKLTRTMAVAVERAREERTELARPLDVSEILDDAWDKHVELVGQHAVDPSRPSGDGGDEDHATGPHDATRFAEGPQPIGSAWEVVHRTQQEHRIDRAVEQIDIERVAHGRVHADEADRRRGRGRLFDVERHEVAVVHAAAEPGQPHGVPTGATSDVGNGAGKWWQVATDDLLRAGELDRSHAGIEPIAFQTELVVLVQRPSLVSVHAGKSDDQTPRHEHRFRDRRR